MEILTKQIKKAKKPEMVKSQQNLKEMFAKMNKT